jgi:hypothetical protein
MRTEVSGVMPDERLTAIRRRTEQSSRSTWWVPIASALAALGLVGAAVVGVAELRDGSRPGQVAGSPTDRPEERREEPPEEAITVAERLVTVWVLRDRDGGPADTRLGNGPPDGVLVPVGVPMRRSGDPGLDAVRALLDYDASRGEYNVWADGIGDGLDLDVRSVEHEDTVVRVDFDGSVSDPWPTADVSWAVDTELFAQQLVRTVQSALDTTDPVLVTQDGEPVDAVLTASVDQPIAADDDSLPSVYLTSPTGSTVISGDPSTFKVTGESNTFEATVNWRVLEGDDVVRKGYAMGGSYGEWKPFSFDLDLPPGTYTVEVFEMSAKDGSRLSLNSIDLRID